MVTKKTTPSKKTATANTKVAASKTTASKKAAPKKAASRKPATKPKSKTSVVAGTPSPDDDKAWAPGELVKHDETYSIVYAKFPHCEAFDEHGSKEADIRGTGSSSTSSGRTRRQR